MRPFTRIHALALGLIAGILIGLGLFDGCSQPKVVERRTVTRHTDTIERITLDTVQIPVAYAVVKWRDRRGPVAQIDSSRGTADTVLVCEPFEARWEGIDSTNGARAHGWVRYPPLRVADLSVFPSPDTSRTIRDSVTIEIETVRMESPIVAIGVGPYVGVDHEMKLRYGAAIWAGLILGSW